MFVPLLQDCGLWTAFSGSFCSLLQSLSLGSSSLALVKKELVSRGWISCRIFWRPAEVSVERCHIHQLTDLKWDNILSWLLTMHSATLKLNTAEIFTTLWTSRHLQCPKCITGDLSFFFFLCLYYDVISNQISNDTLFLIAFWVGNDCA